MNIGFYSPYLDSLSGGERYVLTLASHWSGNHTVSLFWDEADIIKKSSDRFHLDLSRVRTVENVFKTRNLFKKMVVSRGYDLIFFLTDGSIPTTFARRNILHFQVPFHTVRVHPIKLSRFQAIVCNSRFTKDHLDGRIRKRSIVIYPPVEPIKRTGSAKKHMILSVGRFHPVKKQDVLMEIFRKGINSKQLAGFELHLAGGLQPADKAYFHALETSAKGLPVKLHPNCSFNALTSLYNDARIYWHAAGYRESRPEHMEHFGMTTVEAMSAGCIPVVFKAGGQPEITDQNLWSTPDECLQMTEGIIKNKKAYSALARDMREQAEKFSVGAFIQAFDELLLGITR